MRSRISLRWAMAVVAVLLVGSGVLMASVLDWTNIGRASATANTFSGRATVLQGEVLGVQIPCVASLATTDCRGVGDTGDVAVSGGDLNVSLLCYPEGAQNENCLLEPPDLTSGMVRARVIHAAVVSHGNKSRAEASTAEFAVDAGNVLGLGDVKLSAEFLQARAEATCTNGQLSARGTVDIASVNGERILTISVGPVSENVVIPEEAVNFDVVAALPDALRIPLQNAGVQIIVNKQPANQPPGEITLTALYVKVPAADTELFIAQAHADIACGANPPGCSGAEKVTGGGWVGPKNNFAVAGRQNSTWGHFLFTNHQTKDKFKATTILSMTFDPAGFAVISGTGEVNGSGSYGFTVKVKDNGEPGRGSDQFALESSHPSINQPLTILGGGNIQFHKPCK